MTKEEDKRQEEQVVEEELTMNNFPQEVIVREKKMARKRNQENERMEGRTDGDTSKGKESKRTVTISYIKGMSEAIRRVLAPLGIRTAMRSERIKWSVLRGIKDREDKTEVPGVLSMPSDAKSAKRFTLAKQKEKRNRADTRIGRVDKSAIDDLQNYCLGTRRGIAADRGRPAVGFVYIPNGKLVHFISYLFLSGRFSS